MLNEEWSEKFAKQVMKSFAEMQDRLLSKVAERLESLDELSLAELQEFSTNAAMSEAIEEDVDYIKRQLESNDAEIRARVPKIFENATKDIFEDAKRYFDYRNIKIKDIMKRSDTVNLINKLQKETVSGLLNLSHTYCYEVGGEVAEIGKAYRKIVNRAVIDAASGRSIDDVVKDAVNRLSEGGIKTLQWDNDNQKAVIRRADSHIRMNIEEGINRLNQRLSEHNAKIFGADGVQISMHALCAPDHQDIQGMQYSIKEFEDINNSLTRPIGTLNCKHWISYCILDVAKPLYSEQERQEARSRSNAIVTYNNKQMTRYEASQRMRAYERNIRKTRSAEQAYRNSGETALANRANEKITAQLNNYRNFCHEVGLTTRIDRTKYVI